jgi:hypothetical protein
MKARSSGYLGSKRGKELNDNQEARANTFLIRPIVLQTTSVDCRERRLILNCKWVVISTTSNFC